MQTCLLIHEEGRGGDALMKCVVKRRGMLKNKGLPL